MHGDPHVARALVPRRPPAFPASALALALFLASGAAAQQAPSPFENGVEPARRAAGSTNWSSPPGSAWAFNRRTPAPTRSFCGASYLDVIGTLPTAEEAAQFLADQDPRKRAA